MKVKFIVKTNIALVLCSVITGVIFCFYTGIKSEYIVGIAVGCVCALIANTILYLSGKLPLEYRMFSVILLALRMLVIFGSIIITLIIDKNTAIGVILPHIYSVPIMAIFASFYKN